MGTTRTGIFAEQRAERQDKVRINFELKSEAYQRHRDAIRTLKPDFQPTDIRSGDTFRLKYTFNIDYYEVVAGLKAVAELAADPGVIARLDCRELEDQRILVYEVLKHLEATIEQVKHRNQH